jgi:hypothetical protein
MWLQHLWKRADLRQLRRYRLELIEFGEGDRTLASPHRGDPARAIVTPTTLLDGGVDGANHV